MTSIFFLTQGPKAPELQEALQQWSGCQAFTGATLDALESLNYPLGKSLIVIQAEQFTGSLRLRLKQQLLFTPAPCIVVCRLACENDARLAIETGVTTFISGQLEPERVPLVISAAKARFAKDQALVQALEHSRQQLDDRRVIDKAKGLLMEAQGLNEAEAYKLLRQQAMQRQLKIAELAQQLIEISES